MKQVSSVFLRFSGFLIANCLKIMMVFCILLGSLSSPGICAHGQIRANTNTPSTIWFNPGDLSADFTVETLLSKMGHLDKIQNGELRLKSKIELTSGQVFKYRQYLSDLPVIGSQLTVRCDKNNLPVSWYSTLSNLPFNNSQTFNVNADEATALAFEAIDYDELRAEISSDRVILPYLDQLKYCWRIRIPAQDPAGDWEVFVDGENGDIILVEDRLLRVNGTGSVFLPDPVTTLQDTTLRDADDSEEAIPDEGYRVVEIRDLQPDENNQYTLTGPYVDTSPSEIRAIEDEPDFLYNRADDRFEEVMAYYHIDCQARYLIELGFNGLPPAPQLVDVNRIEQDLSFYSPFTGILTTGTGGVDDAEDADVLIHEYTHALVHTLTDDWRGGETLILAEGLCDYFAGDYSFDLDSNFQPYKLFNWDGHNEFWAGRILNSDLSYPEIENLNPHIAGQMWSSLLTEILMSARDRDMWNSIVLDHISVLGDSTSIRIAAESLLHSDIILNNAGFRRYIVHACESRDILIPGEFSPTITHINLFDSEDLDSVNPVRVGITSQLPLDPNRLWLIYGFTDEDPDTVSLRRENEEDHYYQAEIPAPGTETDVDYYFVATDTTGVFSTLPAGAPLTSFRFSIGPDRQPPSIILTDSLGNTVFREHAVNFSARVIDNLGISEVSLVLFNSRQHPLGKVILEPVREYPEKYQGRIHWRFEGNSPLLYQVNAIDDSRSRNLSSSAMRTFSLQEEAVLDGFENESSRWLLTGWQRLNSAALSGRWGIADRESREVDTPREAIAELDESCDLTTFRKFRVFFWENHHFNRADGEVGLCEISMDQGESWTEIMQITGMQFWWERRELDLDEFTGENGTPLRIRWRSITPVGAQPGDGWTIDNIFLSTDNVVHVGSDILPAPESQVLWDPFPNPTNGKFDISYQLSLPGHIRIIDLNGRNIMHIPINNKKGNVSIDMEDFSSGSYFIMLENAQTVQRKQIILLR